MARRTRHLALVVFALLVATGPSALVLADADGSAAADPGGETADSGGVAAVGPLDATDDLSDDETTDENLTDEITTDDTDGNLTDENTTDDTDGNLTDATGENETVDDEAADAIETVIDETNATDGNATADTADADATTESGDPASDAASEAENAPSGIDRTDTREVGIDEANAADLIEIIEDATGGVTDANSRGVPLDATVSSSPRADAVGVGDAFLGDGIADDEGFASSAPDDSDSSTGQERRTENVTTTAAGTGGDVGADGDAKSGDAKSSASGADSDGSPDRDSSGAQPSGTETVAGVGALTAVALFPHLADGLSLAGDARVLSAASSTAASSRSLVPLQGEFDKVWRTATAFRYSRYDDSDPLAHETRAELHETVERSPGAYLSQVCERADVAVSTARHHLDVLEDEGLVTTAKVRGKRRYFPAHSDDVELAAALEDDEAAEVLRALARLGDSHGGRLADELDRDPSTVSHHLSRLEDAGLVEREREGRAVVNRLAPGVEGVFGDERVEESEEADAEVPAVAD